MRISTLGLALKLVSWCTVLSQFQVLGADIYEILEAIYYETGGPSKWQTKSGWQNGYNPGTGSTFTYCDWHGITCFDVDSNDARHGHIQTLDLSNNGLQGTLPDMVFDIPSLYELNVKDNPDLTVSTYKIYHATELHHLIISETYDPDFTNLEKAKDSLSQLHVTACQIGGSIPWQFFQLTNLYALYANFNNFEGTLSPDIAKLTNLRELFLYENNLQGSLPKELFYLSKLELLALSGNSFSGNIESNDFNSMTNLQLLALNHDPSKTGGFTGPLPSFEQLSSLTQLYLQNNFLTGPIPNDFLYSAPRHEKIIVDLANNHLSGKLESVSLSQFQYMNIYLDRNQFTSIDSTLCNNNVWMDGAVEQLGCDAILCPTNSYAENGRAENSAQKCSSCPTGGGAEYLGSTQCVVNNQREILNQFFWDMDGDNWNDSEWWDDYHECDWRGITCDSNKRVTKIELSNNNLSGFPGEAIFKLPNLQVLNLSQNNIDFRFNGIAQAENLEILNLYATGLESLEHMDQLRETNIRQLILSGNNINDEIPDYIYDFTSLEYIALSYNNFHGTLSPLIEKLVNLEKFHAYGNDLTGSIPSQFSQLSNTLVELVLSENDFTGVIPSSFNSMSALEYLSIHQSSNTNGGLSGSLPNFANCKNLDTIHLSYNSLTGTIPTDLLSNSNQLSNLIDIDLSHNQLTGHVSGYLSRFSKLNINLSDNKINDISSTLCSKNDWQDGDVGDYGCAAILCDKYEFSASGRRGSGISCESCPSNNYMGATYCGQSDDVREILTSLFLSTDGNNWNDNSGWLQVDDYCTWYGITCYGGNIVKIDLSDNNLSGTPNHSIFYLSELKELDLEGNPIDFSFYKIEGADKLQVLYLSNTQTSSLEGVGKAAALKELHLTSNYLTGTIPEELFDLTTLEALYMNYNQFSGKLSTRLGLLTNLGSLFLMNNDLSGQIPASIGNLKNLKYLSLGNNNFSGTLPEELNMLTKLEVLGLQHASDPSGKASLGPGIGGPLLSFNKLPKIQELLLGYNSLTGSIPYDLLDSVEVKDTSIMVQLNGNKLSGTVPSSLTIFEALDIKLSDNLFEDIAPGLCSMLEWMNGDVRNYNCNAILCPPGTYSNYEGRQSDQSQCWDCPSNQQSIYWGASSCLTDEDEDAVKERTTLEIFFQFLNGSAWFSKENWLDDYKSFCDWEGISCVPGKESVQGIKLPNNGLTGVVPSALFSLPNLEDVNLSGNIVEINFDMISASKLKYLNIDSTGTSTLTGLKNCPNLLLLHASDNNFEIFPHPVFDLPELEVLYLSYNNFGIPLPTELGSMANLIYFQCKQCGLTGSIPSWISNLDSLIYLSLPGNSLTGSIPSALSSMPNLEHLDLSDQISRGGTGLSGSLPTFSAQDKLSELYLNKNNLSGSINSNFLLKVSTTSVKVDLRNNKLTGGIPNSFINRFDDFTFLLAGNMIDDISNVQCSSDFELGWNGGDVQAYGCDGFMCAKGYYNPLGRRSNDIVCEVCDDAEAAQYYGSIKCGSLPEMDNLEIFYYTLSGPDWVNNDNWLENYDVCTWYGVTCDGSKNVVGLSLEDNGLLGTVPQQLFDIPSLVAINLKSNPIVIESFNGIEKLTNLAELKLSETALDSAAGLENAKSLTTLHLTSNLFTSFPEEIYSLTNLEALYMNFNPMTGNLSSNIGKLTSLKELYLFRNDLSGNIPSQIGSLKQLEILALGENRFSGSIPSSLSSLPKLEILSLQGPGMSNGIGGPLDPDVKFDGIPRLSGAVPSLSNLPALREVYLSYQNLDGPIPNTFLSGVNDKSVHMIVDLSMNKISGSVPTSLLTFKDMEIYLAGNEITDLDDSFCSSQLWMNGEVAQNSCEAIICPVGTYNIYGRETNDMDCMPCPVSYAAPFYGRTFCAADTTVYSEREILMMLYDSTGGEQWYDNHRWGQQDVSICDWHGVHCKSEDDASLGDAGNVITEIHLPSNNLIGTIPSQVFSLENIVVLNFRDNAVDFNFIGVGLASELQQLYLDSTLVKSINGIHNAKKLEILHLQECNFDASPIPEQLYGLTNLKELYISDANFGGNLSSGIGQLTALKEFYCHGNELTGTLPKELGDLNSLEVLMLSENRFIGPIPPEIQNLSKLQYLYIDHYTRHGAGLSGPLPSFKGMSKLNQVFLGGNTLTGTIPSNFLEDLDEKDEKIVMILKDNRLEGTVPSSLSRFSKLNIDLADNLITKIHGDLCEMEEWMSGGVNNFLCDAILCPSGTYNQYGRQTATGAPCKPCEGSEASIYMGATVCPSEVKMKERKILEAFYKACGGNKWKENSGWMSKEVDICQWHGIKCMSGGSIDSILLGSNNLVGTPPKELFELTNLKNLWLYSNPINFSFVGIEKAKQLSSLLLDATGLTSLEGIGGAYQLKDLDLRFNSLKGTVPAEFLNLFNLEKLSLSQNQLEGPIPSFGKLLNLKSLRLENNNFEGTLPSFSKHKSLKALDVSGNQLIGTIPEDLLASVDEFDGVYIDVSSNWLMGTVPAQLDRFEGLTLYVADNLIEGIDDNLCGNDDWNNGDVGAFGCDGIACPPGTFEPTKGRNGKGGFECVPCKDALFYGQSKCTDYTVLFDNYEKGNSAMTMRSEIGLRIGILLSITFGLLLI